MGRGGRRSRRHAGHRWHRRHGSYRAGGCYRGYGHGIGRAGISIGVGIGIGIDIGVHISVRVCIRVCIGISVDISAPGGAGLNTRTPFRLNIIFCGWLKLVARKFCGNGTQSVNGFPDSARLSVAEREQLSATLAYFA